MSSDASTGAAADIERVARNQRVIIWVIFFRVLLLLGTVVVFGIYGGQALPAGVSLAVVIARLVQFGLFVVAVVFVVMLMDSMRMEVWKCVVAAIAVLLPWIGLIVLVVVNGKATRLLRGAGYEVGLMGARGR